MHRKLPLLHFCTVTLLALLVLASLPGCGNSAPVEPEVLSLDPHSSGNNQTDYQGEELKKPLKVFVEGAQRTGLLGGKGSRPAAPGALVRFEIVNTECGAVFCANGDTAIEVTTDVSGGASASLRLGEKSGDVMVTASLVDIPEIPSVRLRAVSGVQRIGKDLEASTGGAIEGVGVRIQNPDASPAEGIEVYFRVEGEAEGSAFNPSRVLTDDEGIALSTWKLGKITQPYHASVEIRDTRPDISPEDRFISRPISLSAMATNKREMAIVLFGGLAIFIFGMKLMSEGLQRVADRRLKSVLQFMTQNRVMAVGAGALITAMVQSSSASTVMTVGFVNAGLMTLQQAIGVVYGANIGTTITAQIIAFNLDALSYPAIALGLLAMGVSKSPQMKSLGQAVLGFGLLFLGMTTMAGILKPLRYSPEFVSWFSMFNCAPVDGGMVPPGRALMCIMIGTLTTVVVQSSSATVGLVLALASQGLLDFYTAFPLILGDNIGTTITANLAAIGTNRNARRAALAHTLFNVFGTVYMYGLLFVPVWNGQPVFLGLVDWLTPGDAFRAEPENLLRHVANSHTLFNVFNVVFFTFFIGTMAKACNILIPFRDSERDSVLQYLDPKLLKTPSIALQQAVKEVTYMIRQGEKSMDESCELLLEGKRELEPKILMREDMIDRLQHEITEFLVGLSRAQLDSRESALIPALIHMVNDAERLGDHAESLVELHRLLKEGGFAFSDEALKSVSDFKAVLDQVFDAVFKCLDSGDDQAVKETLRLHRVMEGQVKRLTDKHVERLDAGQCHVQAGVIYLDVVAHIERVGDHLLNIAERADKIAQVTAG